MRCCKTVKLYIFDLIFSIFKADCVGRVPVYFIWVKRNNFAKMTLREETSRSVMVKNEISVYLTCFSAFVQCTIHEINIF